MEASIPLVEYFSHLDQEKVASSLSNPSPALLTDAGTMHSSPFHSRKLTEDIPVFCLYGTPAKREQQSEEDSVSLFPYLCKQQKILLSGLGKQHPLAVAPSAGSPSTALNRSSDAGATFLAMGG